MVYLVTGGSGSGKSAFAEKLAVELKNQTFHGGLYYIATMHCYDEESKKRISRHREMRKDKCFETIERELFLEEKLCPQSGEDFDTLDLSGTYLLEDLSNLLANEMYIGTHKELFFNPMEDDKKNGVECLYEKIKLLSEKTGNLIIVTNEIFSDNLEYEEQTQDYMRKLGYLNGRLAKLADAVVEVVAGIPVIWKGKIPC